MQGDDQQQAAKILEAINRQQREIDDLRDELEALDAAGLRAEVADLRDLAETVLRALLDRDGDELRSAISALLDAQDWHAA